MTQTTITDLRCEYAINPLGIDVAEPRLSWKLVTDRRGAAQSAYRVTVGTVPGAGDLWDSGRVESDQSIQIVYGGTPLKSRERAFLEGHHLG